MKKAFILCAIFAFGCVSFASATPVLKLDTNAYDAMVTSDNVPLKRINFENMARVSEDINLGTYVTNKDFKNYRFASQWAPSWFKNDKNPWRYRGWWKNKRKGCIRPPIWIFKPPKQDPPNPVPEPATMLLFGSGLVGLAAVGRKKKVNK